MFGVISLAFVVSGCAGTEGSREVSAPHGSVVSVVGRVVDGDTLYVDGLQERVRLIGIDTPEVAGAVECYGEEASRHLEELLPVGTRVEVAFDVERYDRYGRNLGYVYRFDDDLFVNLQMAIDGFALLLTVPPNVAHVEEFRQAQDQARAANRGLWAACDG